MVGEHWFAAAHTFVCLTHFRTACGRRSGSGMGIMPLKLWIFRGSFITIPNPNSWNLTAWPCQRIYETQRSMLLRNHDVRGQPRTYRSEPMQPFRSLNWVSVKCHCIPHNPLLTWKHGKLMIWPLHEQAPDPTMLQIFCSWNFKRFCLCVSKPIF